MEKLTKNPIQFTHEVFGSLTTVTNGSGEIYFIGKEVALLLGYSDTSQAIRLHCKGAVDFTLPSQGGDQVMKIIPERDLYRLVIKSKKPDAERFEEWVVGDVLPSIRKTGSYSMVQNTPQTYLDALRALVAAEEHKLQLQAQLQEAKPKVEVYDKIADRNALTTLRDTAKELKIGEKAMINMLLYNQFLYRDMSGQLKPIAKYVKDGLFELKVWTRDIKLSDGTVSEKSGNQTMVTIKGKSKILELINKAKNG